MKIKIGFLIFFAAALFCSSCVVNSLGIFDDSVPEEQRVNVVIRNNMSVTFFNNQMVDWNSKYTQKNFSIDLPSGENTFVVEWVEKTGSGANIKRVDNSFTVSQVMLPGHSYRIYKQYFNFVFMDLNKVKIKEVTPKSQTKKSSAPAAKEKKNTEDTIDFY